MAEIGEIQKGTVMEGPFFPEKLRILSIKQLPNDQVFIEGEGLSTHKIHKPIISLPELQKISIAQMQTRQFNSNAEEFFLYIEANRMRNAYQFDPLYAVNVSMVDPLPHQIEAVYHHILKNPKIRYLLADDPGAGKTIMAGLLLKELKYRGLVERVLIIVPGHLRDQWIRELKERFSETFLFVNRDVLNSSWGRNIWKENNQIISSMDFCRQDDIMQTLDDVHWDLVIVDEAHKMSAYQYGEKIDKTKRYRLGELISKNARYLLFLTATPHRGDPNNFRLFLDLLEPGFFATNEMLAESVNKKENPFFLRRLKEDLKDLNQKPLFPPRHVKTIYYSFSNPAEVELYNEVTRYVKNYYNRALAKDKRNVAFALTILQKRLASSVYAARRSLERRRNRLSELLEKGEFIQEKKYFSEEELEEAEEKERWDLEEELLQKLTSAETIEELRDEIGKLDKLIALARKAEKSETETKLAELKKLIESEGLSKSDRKLLVFTESRDTLEYLEGKIKSWGFSVITIHGGMNFDKRIAAEAEFREKAQIMAATEAAGEGINLQFCNLCINYDIPWNPNRLEQRMGRVHRYGQQHEVYIYNLVAKDTHEGKVLKALFSKLERMREHLGSDRVFDVIGDIVPGGNLKDLILQAISGARTMDEILADFEARTDEETLQKIKEATMESLATRHIDLSRILGEERQAKENRLVPEYVEMFFLRAAKILGVEMEKRADGIWRITKVPFEIRNRPHSFKLKYGEVRNEYNRVSFDKDVAFKKEAVFLSMGHPLMEAVIETINERFSDAGTNGTILFDPDAEHEKLLWFLQTEIRDGSGNIAGRRLFALLEDANKEKRLVSPAILWDLKTSDDAANFTSLSEENLELDEDSVVSYLIETSLEPYRKELIEVRKHDAEIKRKYGIRSLEKQIGDSDAKLSDYYIRQGNGEQIPFVTIQNEERKKEDLIRKKEKLEDEIEKETHLLPQNPEVLGIARLIPLPKSEDYMREDPNVELAGMRVALDYEEKQGRYPEDVSVQNLGYDIRSREGEDRYRYIEVKARAREGAVALTPNEWLMAQRLKEEYWLYVVTNATSNPELYLIQNPSEKLNPDEEVNIVRYIVRNWKDKAEATG